MTMNEKTDARPIRVHAGLDVYDLPPDTPVLDLAAGGRGPLEEHEGPLEEHEGKDKIEVEIAGRVRLVAVESDSLAADRWWREAERLREQLSRPAAHQRSEPSAIQPETPRNRDPLVWAATYSAFFVRALDAAYCATDGATPQERMTAALPLVDPDACSRVADAAVMALHVEAGR